MLTRDDLQAAPQWDEIMSEGVFLLLYTLLTIYLCNIQSMIVKLMKYPVVKT